MKLLILNLVRTDDTNCINYIEQVLDLCLYDCDVLGQGPQQVILVQKYLDLLYSDVNLFTLIAIID